MEYAKARGVKYDDLRCAENLMTTLVFSEDDVTSVDLMVVVIVIISMRRTMTITTYPISLRSQ